MFDWDNLPDPPDYFDDEPDEPMGKFINGQWVDFEDLPRGYGNSPDWWDDDGFGETFEEYMEHTD